MGAVIATIQTASFILTLVVLADVIVSFFLAPYHPIRSALDSFVEPMLAPIRRILPSMGMFDFSPVVLLIIIQLVESILVQILLSLA